jgi:hypothetical protein
MKIIRLLIIIIFIVAIKPAKAQLTYETLEVQYDSAWTYKNLQIIPIKYKGLGSGLSLNNKKDQPALSLAHAVAIKKAKIKEINYNMGADVNVLQITNNSKQNIVVNSGELVAGGKQDRIVAGTKIIAPGSTDYLDVFCVEKKRWDGENTILKDKGTANIELRKVMDRKGQQQDVWKEIDRQYGLENKKSDTWSYLKLYPDGMRGDTNYIKFFTEKYARTDSNYAGFLFVTGDKILNCEVFASRELTNLAFGGMLSSVVQTAAITGSEPALPEKQKVEFMDKLLKDEASQKAFVNAHGKMHKLGDRVIHIIVYKD